MLLSVVICTRNRPEDVAACLPSVLACLRGDWELVLVDQSDTEETRGIVLALAARFPGLVYVPTRTVGKSRALNLGVARARGELLAFTDDDCEAPPGWLDAVLAEFEASPTADVLFGPVLPSPSLPDTPDICVPSWSFAEARDLRPGEICGMGANMALRRTVLARLPGGPLFDPSLGPGAPFPAGEEGDFVYRLRRAGARAVLRPSLQLYHRAYRTPERWQSVLRGYGVGDAAFFAKHARCGDGWALRTLAWRLAHGAVRTAGKAVLGRDFHGEAALLGGLWEGLRQSLRLTPDRRTRLYREAGG